MRWKDRWGVGVLFPCSTAGVGNLSYKPGNYEHPPSFLTVYPAYDQEQPDPVSPLIGQKEGYTLGKSQVQNKQRKADNHTFIPMAKSLNRGRKTKRVLGEHAYTERHQ